MFGIGDPGRQSESIRREVRGECPDPIRRSRLNDLHRPVVSSAFEHSALPRLREFGHHHDFAGSIDHSGQFTPERLEFQAGRLLGGIDRTVEVGPEFVDVGIRRLKCLIIMKMPNLDRTQSPIEDAEMIDLPALEAPIPESLADGHRARPTTGDGLGEVVADHFNADGIAVEMDRKPRSPTGTVIRHHHLDPLAHGKWLEGSYSDGISGPEVDQRPTDSAILQKKLVALTSRIGPGPRTMKHHGPIRDGLDPDPQGDREGIDPAEFTHPREVKVVLAIHAEARGVDARNRNRGTGDPTRPGRVSEILELAIDDLVERIVPHQTRDQRRQRITGDRQGSVIHPGLERRRLGGLQDPDRRFGGGDPTPQVIDSRLGLGGGQQEGRGRNRTREVGIEPAFVDVVEEREEFVVLLMADRIELVTVTASTLGGEPQKCGSEGVHPVGHVLDPEFLFDAAALIGLTMQSIERRRQALVGGRVGEQITCQLPGHEIVVGKVLIERPDDPVPVRPHRPINVALIAVRIRETSQVQPGGGHSLAEGR